MDLKELRKEILRLPTDRTEVIATVGGIAVAIELNFRGVEAIEAFGIGSGVGLIANIVPRFFTRDRQDQEHE